ncbi:predicted protein [Naegleria gruberi]|uniref:Predicted protein n=1 Tax=Naegleria gruberi TaxID=5762 RepID=D2VJC8_NAEGR|nr:uncharacterized protein NAEGRDRAFT_68992 [Naegleria gruberi]EFC42922.1 predicted protein [Naegleria gruberi]|eukprot:XP_002675666.1 predicted protein [Naegleria gruberi strain NEG-M]
MPKQPCSSQRNGKTSLETDQILLEYYLIHGNYLNINQSNADYHFTNSQSKQRWRRMKECFTNRVIQSNPSTNTTLHKISLLYPNLKKTILFSITLNDEEKIIESTRKEIAINPPPIQQTPYNRKGVSTFEIHPDSETIKQYFQNLLHNQTHVKKVSLKEINAIWAEIGFAHYKSKNTTNSEPVIAAQLCSLNGKSYESVKQSFKVHSKLYHKKEKCSQCMGFACFNYSILCKGCTYLKLIDHDPVIWIQKTANPKKIEWTFTLSNCNNLNYTSLFNLKYPVDDIQSNDLSIQSDKQDEMSIQSDENGCDNYEEDEMMDETNVTQSKESNQSIQERIQTFYTSCHDYCNIFQEEFNGFQEWKPKFQNYEPPHTAHQLMNQAMVRNRNLLKLLPLEENYNFIWIQNGSEKKQYSQWIELIEKNFKLKTLDNFNATDPIIYVMIFIFKKDYQMEPMIQIGESENYQKRMNGYKYDSSDRLINRAFSKATLIFSCPLEIQADTPIRKLKETFYICQLLEQAFHPLNSNFSDPDSVNRLHSIFDGKINFSTLDRLNYSSFNTSLKLLHLDSDANNTIHIEKGNYVIESNNQVVLRKPFIFMLEREKFKHYFPHAPQKLLNAFNIASIKYQGLNNLLYDNDELYKEEYLPKCFGIMNRIVHPKGFGKYLRFDFPSACLEYENGFYPISFLSIRCNYEQVIRKVIMKNTIMKDCICINDVEDDNFI